MMNAGPYDTHDVQAGGVMRVLLKADSSLGADMICDMIAEGHVQLLRPLDADLLRAVSDRGGWLEEENREVYLCVAKQYGPQDFRPEVLWQCLEEMTLITGEYVQLPSGHVYKVRWTSDEGEYLEGGRICHCLSTPTTLMIEKKDIRYLTWPEVLAHMNAVT